MFGTDPQASDAYGRIVDERHFDRVSALLGSGTTAFGGQTDRDDTYISPTVLTGVKPDEPVMREEIFGRVLPIVEVAGLDEAIEFINDRDKPLALYGFTESEDTRRRLVDETSSGGIGFGLPMAHLRVPELPFGGRRAAGGGRRAARAVSATTTARTPSRRSATARPGSTYRWAESGRAGRGPAARPSRSREPCISTASHTRVCGSHVEFARTVCPARLPRPRLPG